METVGQEEVENEIFLTLLNLASRGQTRPGSGFKAVHGKSQLRTQKSGFSSLCSHQPWASYFSMGLPKL